MAEPQPDSAASAPGPAPRRRRLLIALNYYAPYVSGVTEHVRHLAESLADVYDVTVVCGQHDPGLATREVVNGVLVLRAPLLFRLHKGYISPALFAMFHREAAQADVVNLQLPMLEAGIFCRLARGRPIVCTYHCDLDTGGSLLDKAAVTAVRASAASALRYASKVVVSTIDYADGSPYLSAYRSRLVEVIPPPSRFERHAPLAGTSDAGLRVGFVGRFVAEKGIDVLLRAVPLVLQRHPEVQFVLVGDTKNVAGGTVFSKLKADFEALADKITLTGRVDDAELWRRLWSFDVLVLPSVNAYEAFGLAQVEAMLAGALVVASNLRGVRVPVQRTGLGTLCEPGNAEALAEAICKTLVLRRTLTRQEVRATAIRHFSETNFKVAYLKVFEEAISQAAGGLPSAA